MTKNKAKILSCPMLPDIQNSIPVCESLSDSPVFPSDKSKGKVLPRTGREGPEGGRAVALLFL
jgi:hypothetical protein